MYLYITLGLYHFQNLVAYVHGICLLQLQILVPYTGTMPMAGNYCLDGVYANTREILRTLGLTNRRKLFLTLRLFQCRTLLLIRTDNKGHIRINWYNKMEFWICFCQIFGIYIQWGFFIFCGPSVALQIERSLQALCRLAVADILLLHSMLAYIWCFLQCYRRNLYLPVKK